MMNGKKGTDQSHIRAFLGEGTEFEGLLSFDGTVRIDGKFRGEIHTADTLIIGESGNIEAEIKAGQVIIMGALNGNIKAAQKVEITHTGRLSGDINTPALVVHEGGVLEGNIRMKKDAELPKKPSAGQDARIEVKPDIRQH